MTDSSVTTGPSAAEAIAEETRCGWCGLSIAAATATATADAILCETCAEILREVDWPSMLAPPPRPNRKHAHKAPRVVEGRRRRSLALT